MEPSNPTPWRDKLATLPEYLIPQHLLSRAMHRLTRMPAGRLKNAVIRRFIQRFAVDMGEAAEPEPEAYPTFNAFFTRGLRDGARPVCGDAAALASPVDGTVSQRGTIRQGRIFQAKGHDFGLLDLLGGNQGDAAPFDGGQFATLYLSPRDYHRIHVPAAATLRRMVYVPGRLFAVKPSTVRTVPALFARNERVVCLFDTEFGPMAMVLVGAIFVGSIETVWQGELTPARRRELCRWEYADEPLEFARGDEIGRFNMGSTVILLFGPDSIQWQAGLQPGSGLRMGQCIAERASGAVR